MQAGAVGQLVAVTGRLADVMPDDDVEITPALGHHECLLDVAARSKTLSRLMVNVRS